MLWINKGIIERNIHTEFGRPNIYGLSIIYVLDQYISSQPLNQIVVLFLKVFDTCSDFFLSFCHLLHIGFRWKEMMKKTLAAVEVVTLDYPCEWIFGF